MSFFWRNPMNKLLTLTLLMSIGSVVNAAKVYKWVDENGQIHYSSNKPVNQEAETVKLKKGPKIVPKKEVETEAVPGKQGEEIEEPVDPKAEKEAKKQMAKADAANRQKQCDAARKNLAALNASTRVATIDPDTGVRTYMTDDQRVKGFQQANKAIRDNCK